VTVRGIGVVTLADIGNIVLTQQGGVPVLLWTWPRFRSASPRLGIAGRDGVTDIVTGIVLMQKFERTSEVVARVRAASTDQHRRHLAARGQGRAVLRPRRPGVDHGADRAAQHVLRDRADLSHPVGVLSSLRCA
jgi:hypothetical protein